MNPDGEVKRIAKVKVKHVWIDGTGQTLKNIHKPELCEGRPCVIHNPSDHHMRSWPTHARFDLLHGGVDKIERLCEHGVGHPDPDDLDYRISIGEDYKATHGCDGCCQSPDGLVAVVLPNLPFDSNFRYGSSPDPDDVA